jgi:hypothetical protein
MYSSVPKTLIRFNADFLFWVVFFCLNTFFSFSLHAQKNERLGSDHVVDSKKSKSDFQKVEIEGEEIADSLEAYLLRRIEKSEISGVGIKMTFQKESAISKHYSFNQHYKGVLIYRSEIKVNMDRKGVVTSIFDNSYSIKKVASSVFPDTQRIKETIKASYKNPIINLEKFYYCKNGILLPVISADIYLPKSGSHLECVYDSDGNIIYQQDLNSHYVNKSDTLVLASVFLPDPLTTAHVKYGAPYANFFSPGSPYRNYNDSDIVELNNQRFHVNMHTGIFNDTFKLSGPYVIISEFSDPVVKPAWSTSPYFNYTRSQTGFEDVMAYYHISNMQKHVQDLGFSNVANFQIQVDTHANDGADNSNFSFGKGRITRLSFGTGGVPDAQDADVIIHEYGHAINYDIAPGSNSGTERMTIDEGNCDYLAASYSRALDSYYWQYVFNWDGHNEFWKGRVVQTSKKYSSSLSYSSIYINADIWSSTIMQIWELLGRDMTDRILIQSMYGYAQNMTMPDAAKLFINADSLLYGGSHKEVIYATFLARGIFKISTGMNPIDKNNYGIKIENAYAFAESSGPLIIITPENEACELKVFNLSCQLLLVEKHPPAPSISFDRPLSAGMYVLQIRSGERSACFKILKY